MKKLLKITLITAGILIFLLVIALTGAFLFLKNFDIKTAKPKITDILSQTLNRPVDFADIDLSVTLKDGARLHLKDLVIGDDPHFATDPFARVSDISVHMDLLGFLKFKLISIPDVIINKPSIHLIQNSEGAWNFSSLGQKPSQESPASSPSSSSGALPAFLIRSLNMEDGIITASRQSPDASINLNNIDLSIQELSLTKSFPVSLKAALESPAQNISVNTQVRLNLNSSGADLTHLTASLDLTTLDWNRLSSFPLLAALPLPRSINGTVNVSSAEIILSDKGVSRGKINLLWNNGAIDFPDAAPGVSIIAQNINLNIQNYPLAQPEPFDVALTAAAFGEKSNIDLHSRITFDPASARLSINDARFKTDLSLWDITRLKKNISALKDLPLPEKVTGDLDVSVDQMKTENGVLKSILMDLTLSQAGLTARNILPDSAIDLNNISLTVRRFSLDQPFDLALSAGLLNPTPNISLISTATLDLTHNATAIQNSSLKINLDQLPLQKLQAAKLIPQDILLPSVLKGQLNIDVKQLDVSPKGLGSILFNAALNQGEISITDPASGFSANVNRVNLKAVNVSLDKPFTVEGSLAYENTRDNLQFKSTVTLDPGSRGGRISDGTLETNLGLLPLKTIQGHVPALKTIKLPQILEGILTLKVHELAFDPKGLNSIAADVTLNNGRIDFPDVINGVNLKASSINADIQSLSLSQPSTFKISLALLDKNPNLFLDGKTQLNLPASSIRFENTSLLADLSRVSLEELKTSVAAAQNVLLPEMIGGHLEILLTEATADISGIKNLLAKAKITDGAIKLKDMPQPVEKINLDLQTTDKNMTINSMTANIGEGRIAASAEIKEFLTTPAVTAALTLDRLSLNDVLNQTQAPVKLQGLLTGNLKLAGLASDPKSFNGSGSVSSSNTMIKDLNVLKTVLDKTSVIPGLSQKLQTNLPPDYQAKLKEKDTTIKKAEFALTILNGDLVLNPTLIQADEFTLDGMTRVSLEQAYTVDGTFTIPVNLSQAMVKAVPDMEYLLDINNAISMPVKVRGQGSGQPQFSTQAVLKDVGKKILTNVATKELFKALGVSTSTPSPASGNAQPQSGQTQNSDAATSDSSSSQPDPAKKLINDVIGTIFQ